MIGMGKSRIEIRYHIALTWMLVMMLGFPHWALPCANSGALAGKVRQLFCCCTEGFELQHGLHISGPLGCHRHLLPDKP